ncbi:NAD(P)-dependent oxidoreductase [Kineosporia succinea]|uniref:NADH-flavin reductase n=1 Tax=Kineosporia succinea TaxID=84632 RepID=A0ABT9PA68_9ACTN|nr:NAD(P)H-binding protein [Kineosporia succinea]MDP9829586.1 putative NADH-flavin reductase [Kineosporia succinea]
MARLAVLGATGRTGQEIVRRALDAGHEVTALVRRPEALPVRDASLTVVVGDARDAEVIAAVSEGRDAVIASLGRPESGRTKDQIDDSQPVDVCEVSTRHLLEAAGRGLRRIVLMSTHGAGSSNDGSPYVVKLRDMVGNRVVDKDRMEQVLLEAETDVVWTVIRNPYIYEGPLGTPHAVHEKIVLDETSRITYADLATFAIGEALRPQYPNTFLTITEPLTGSAS